MPQNVPCPHKYCGCVYCTVKRLKESDEHLEIEGLKAIYEKPAPIPHKFQ